MARAFLKVFFDFEERTEELGDAERGRLLLAMLRYAKTGEVPELSGNERFLWPVFKGEIDEQIRKYNQLVANGSLGGRPKKEEDPEGIDQPEEKPTETKQNQTKPNETKRNQTETKENRNEQEKEQEQEQDCNYDDEDDSRARAREAEVRESFLEEFGRQPTPAETQQVCFAADVYGFGEGVAGYAVHLAALNSARNPGKYIRKILEEWRENRLHSMDEVSQYQLKKDANRGKVENDHVLRHVFGVG